MKPKLRELIFRYLSENQSFWVHKGQIERRCIMDSWGYEADTCARLLRKLAENGEIQSKKNEQGEVMYKYITLMDKIVSEREDATYIAAYKKSLFGI